MPKVTEQSGAKVGFKSRPAWLQSGVPHPCAQSGPPETMSPAAHPPQDPDGAPTNTPQLLKTPDCCLCHGQALGEAS